MSINISENILSIVIPTYNRSDIVKENINDIIDSVVKNNVVIYISDDSICDLTRVALDKHINKYPDNLKYIRNSPSLGHDANCVYSLSLPDSEYIWYLGDSNVITSEAIVEILSVIASTQPDLLFLRRDNKYLPTNNQVIHNNKIVMNDYAWHLTLSGSTIYKKSSLKLSDELYEFHNFPQSKITYEILKREGKYFYLGGVTLKPHVNKSVSYWKSEPFSVFGYDWLKLIDSLEFLSKKERAYIVKSHSKKTGLFGVKGLLKLRVNGYLSISYLIRNLSMIKKVVHVPLILVLIITFLPPKLAKLIIE